MSESGLWIKLGSGKTEQHGVHGIATLLDRAARAGLNVPKGVVILDTVWDQAILRGLLVIGHGTMDVPSPQHMLRFLNLPEFDSSVIMQPAFSNRQNVSQPHSHLGESTDRIKNLNMGDAYQMVSALSQIWTSAIHYLALETGAMPRVDESGEMPAVRPQRGTRSTDEISLGQFVRRDVLLTESISAQVSGIAYTQQAYEDDLILVQQNTTTRPQQRLMDNGEAIHESALLPKLRGWERHRASALKQITQEAWSPRLQEMLREVRRWVGQQQKGDWKIEWADDGEKCWLLWIEPVKASPPGRQEKLIPALPEDMRIYATKLSPHVASCAGQITAYFRQFEPDITRVRPLFVTHDGNYLLNIGLIAEFLRGFGLSTRRLHKVYHTDFTASGEPSLRVYPINRRRILVKSLRLTLLRFWLSQIRLAWKIQRGAAVAILIAEQDNTEQHDLPTTFDQLYIWYITQVISFERLLTPMVHIARRLGRPNWQTPHQTLQQAMHIVAVKLTQESDEMITD